MAEAKSTAGALENTNYQLLPALHKDDYERLKADIALRGVMVPVEVDEDGAILDGHHRVMIARELGIKCPTKVRKGLPDYEKRLHAVALNLARRQLSDAQKTVLGEKIEPDIAERARARQLAELKQNKGAVVENFPQRTGKSRDEVAQAVGLGSGKTYENHKKTLSEAKEVAPEVVERAWCGEADMKAVRKEVKKAKKEKREQAAAEVTETVESVEGKEVKSNIEAGTWTELGRHRLYCGDSSSYDFIAAIQEQGARLVFADPPYNAEAAEWDEGFEWGHDFLCDVADFVVVTPGIISIPQFLRATEMPYRWAIAAHITNGMTRGAIGFGNWIFGAVFSRGSVHLKEQDCVDVAIGNHPGAEHKGRKPAQFVAWVIETFTKPNDLIIDPFAGSGTTLLMAEKLGRRCITAEIIPEYCEGITSAFAGLSD